MADERNRILKMLEDGKITAEEAAQLLKALRTMPWEMEGLPFLGPKFHKGFAKGFERIPEIVTSVVEEILGGKAKFVERSFSEKEHIAIKAVNNDVVVSGWDKAEVLVAMTGWNKIQENDNRLEVKALAGDVNVKLPNNTKLEVSSVSGDVKIEGIKSEFEIRTTAGDVELKETCGTAAINTISGNIEGRGLDGNFLMKSQSGDIDLAFDSSNQGEFETTSGDITITLPKDANLVLEVTSEYGDIKLDILKPFEKIEEWEGYLKIGFGERKGKFLCRTKSGDIEIKG